MTVFTMNRTGDLFIDGESVIEDISKQEAQDLALLLLRFANGKMEPPAEPTP